MMPVVHRELPVELWCLCTFEMLRMFPSGTHTASTKAVRSRGVSALPLCDVRAQQLGCAPGRPATYCANARLCSPGANTQNLGICSVGALHMTEVIRGVLLSQEILIFHDAVLMQRRLPSLRGTEKLQACREVGGRRDESPGGAVLEAVSCLGGRSSPDWQLNMALIPTADVFRGLSLPFLLSGGSLEHV